jgi:hypothetical protein
MAAAAQEEMLFFHFGLNEAELRQWVEANPGRVNDRDKGGYTPLIVAVCYIKSLPLTVWLLDEKGADVNATSLCGYTPLHMAPSLDILAALLNRGADPTLLNRFGRTPLMSQALYGRIDIVTRLLQDPRVRATVNVQHRYGTTALHLACDNDDYETVTISILSLLLQAGADPALTREDGETPLTYLRIRHPTHHAAIALLERYPEAQKDAEKASLLVKARRLVVLSRNTAAPSYLRGRAARGQPLPRVTLMPVTGGEDEDDEEEEESRKLRTLMAFLLGVEGGWENAGMPRDVFRVVLDLLMPTWDPLRRKDAVAAPPVQQG